MRFLAIVNNTGWLLFDKVFRLGITFVIGIYIIRYLGPERFGSLSFAIAFVSLFTAIANLGLYGIVVRDLVRFPKQRHAIIGTALVLKLIGGGVCVLISIAGIRLIRPDDDEALLLVATCALSLAFQAFEAVEFWFLAQLQSRNSVVAKLPALAVASLLRLGLIYYEASVLSFAIVTLIETALAGIGFLVVYQFNTGNLARFTASRYWAKRLLHDSWPLIFSGLMLMIYTRIDQVMIGKLLDRQAVGIYSAAVKVAEFWYVFPGLLLQSVYSSIIEAREQGEEAFRRQLQYVFDLMALGASIFIVPTCLLSSPIVSALYGDAYRQAGSVLAIYVFSGLFVIIGHVREYWVAVENVTRFSLVCAAFGALVNFFLNLVMIPAYGIRGAAVATLISVICSSYLINAVATRTRPIFIMQSRSLLLLPAAGRLKRALGQIIS